MRSSGSKKSGALANFDRICEDPDNRGHVGMQFIDWDVYKVLEALAWEFGATPGSGAPAEHRYALGARTTRSS